MPPALPPWPAPDAPAAAPAPTTRAPAAPPSRAGPPPSRAPAPPPSTPRPCDCPQPAVRRRPRQPEPQLVEQLRLQDRRSRPVAPSQVAERVRTAGVVPRQQLLDPPHPERGRRGHLGHLVALRQQPDRLDVPGRAGVRRGAEPLPQLRHAQVSRHLRHASASRKPRLQVTGCVTPQEPSPNTSAGNRIIGGSSLLTALTYYDGAIDRPTGPETRSVITAFQRRQAQPATGAVTAGL